MSYAVLNIFDALKEEGEVELGSALSSFSCPLNAEIENFAHNNAIEFAKRKLSITYLVLDDTDGQLLGYFTLTHKAIDIKGSDLSNTSRKKLSRHARYDEDTDIYTASAFLLAQFGKNYAVEDGRRMNGVDLMEYAMDILADIQHRIGGGVVYLDAEYRPKLCEFYENMAGYKKFGEQFSKTDNIRYLQYMHLTAKRNASLYQDILLLVNPFYP